MNLRTTDEPLACQLKQFGHGLQIPVGLVDVDMSEIGGKFGKFAFDIESRAVPVDQRSDSKSMAHIQQTRAAAMPRGLWADSQLLRDLCEGVTRHAICNSSAALGYEKRGGSWSRKEPVSFVAVFLDRKSVV